MIARKSSGTSFTFGTCLHRPLHLGFCGASALFIRVHRALEHYQSYGNADKTEVLALHVALVHFQLCSTLRAVETRRSLSISSHWLRSLRSSCSIPCAVAMSQSPKRPTASGSAPSGSESQYVKDNFVPRFDNTLTGYKEWRKRVVLYSRRLAIQGRAKEVGMNVLAILEGSSWTQCEDIDLKELEGEDGLDVLLARLDKQWQYDDRVEN